MADSLTGRTLGQYRLSERIGVGGMGVVYRAVHQRLGRQAAVKVLPETLASDPNFLRRFEREAANAAALQHNNILAVWDYGEENSVPYLVMPYIASGTLRHRLANGPLRPQEALDYVRQVAEALDYAHSEGIIHRDVKPANLLLDERGQLYLADFGIAKALEGAEGLTRTGMGVGTPEYMAPEQAQGRADSRSDLYALGIILYQMLTGQVPFSGNSTVEVLMKHLQDQPPLTPLRSIQPTLPQGVERVVQKALSKNPLDRYQSGRSLVEALAEALAPESAAGAATYPPPTAPSGAEMQPTTYGPTVPYGPAPQVQTPIPQQPTPAPHPMQTPNPPPLYAQPQYQAPMTGQIPATPPPVHWGGANTGRPAAGQASGGSTNRALIGGLAAAIVVLLLCLTSIGAYALFRDTATPTPVPTVNAAATGTAAALAAFNVQATQTANAPTPIPSPAPTVTPTRPPAATTAPSPAALPTATATRPPAAPPTQPPVVSKNPRGTPIAGWKTFSGHARVPISLYYPPDWTIDTQSVNDGIIYVRPPSPGSTWMLIATTGIPETNGNIDVLRDQYYNNTLGECTSKAIDRTNYTEYSTITFAGLGATCETNTGLTYARIGLGLNNQVPWRYRLNAPYGEYSDALDTIFQPMLNSLNIYQNP